MICIISIKKKSVLIFVRNLPQNDLFCAIGVSAIDSNATLFFVSNGGGPVNDTVENSLTILFGLCLLPLLDILLCFFDWLSWLDVLSTVYSLKIPGRNMKKLNRPVMAPTYLQTLENKHNEILWIWHTTNINWQGIFKSTIHSLTHMLHTYRDGTLSPMRFLTFHQ